jgi:hypothetical protein
MTSARRLGGLAAAVALLACAPAFAAPVCPSSAQARTAAIVPPKVVAQPRVAMIVRPPSVGMDRRVLPLIVPVFTRSTTADPACAGARRPDVAAGAEASRRRPAERPKEAESPRPR